MDSPPTTTPESSKEPSQRWWWNELWYENRELFKELIKHLLIFLTFFGFLVGAHELLRRSHVPKEQIVVIDKIHFYLSVISLVIFAVSFIIKLVVFEVRGKIR